jgi:hypothetical protein
VEPQSFGAGSRASQTEPLPGDDAPDLARLKRYFSEHEQLTADSRGHSLQASDYYDGDQYTPQDRREMAERGQPAIVINRIKAAINGIIGVAERGRSDPKCWPRNPGDEDSADAATDALRYIADFNRFKRLKLDVFRDMLVPGTGAVLVGADSDKNVTLTQIRWEEFFYDPRARRPDFKDARYLGVAKWMYADDVAALYADKAKAIESAVQNAPMGGGIGPDQSFQDRPLSGPGTGGAWIDPKLRRLIVIEMYWRDEGAWSRSVFTGTDILEHGRSSYLDHKGRPDCPIEAQSLYVRRDNGRYGAVWDMIPVQDEVNKRRSKALHLISVSRIQGRDPAAMGIDADLARKEASRPDGVIPFGYEIAPNTAEVQGNVELLAEAKSEIERMGPNAAVLGRSDTDSSGRALLARQQSGLVELANVYGALEDLELRVYRQCWARARQFWTDPQWIRVTDDEDAPRFVGLNQPDPGHPLGYRNRVAEMDVDIEIDTQQSAGNLQSEAFSELLDLVKMSPLYQQQVALKQLILLSPLAHKRSIIDAIDQAGREQQQAQAAGRQIGMAHAAAEVERTRSEAARNQAEGTAKMLNAVSQAHQVRAEHAASGFEAGARQAGADRDW